MLLFVTAEFVNTQALYWQAFSADAKMTVGCSDSKIHEKPIQEVVLTSLSCDGSC
jgi:hypothetical protein